MFIGTQFWQDKLCDTLVERKLSSGRTIQTFPDMPQHLYAFLERSASRLPDKEAVCDDLGRTLTFAQLQEKTDLFADYLEHEMHMGRGSHIALMAYSTVEYIAAFLAVIKTGAIAVIIPTKFGRSEVESLARRSDLDCVICDEQYADWFSEQKEAGVPILSYLPVASGFALDTFRSENSNEHLPSRASGEDVCVMMFTSGTTERSKGVLLTNYNFVHAAGVYRMALDISEEDSTVIPVPVYTITAMSAVIGTFLYVGGTIWLQRKFDARKVLELVRDHHLTYMHAAPTICSLLLQQKASFPELPSLRRIVCGGSRMPAEKIRKLHEWLPQCEYHNVYGMTETTSPATIQKESAMCCKEMASEGFLVPGLYAKVTAENGDELAPGQIGEILLSGACIMQGYYGRETDGFENGWLHTGDYGYFTPNGYCYVTDRKKDMINRGGEKLTSYDVEEELYKIDGITEAVVVGIPDELYGEQPAALIVKEHGTGWEEDGIRAYLRKRIAKYKVPVKIVFTDQIPLNCGGKPDRKQIRKMLSDE